MKMKPFYLLLCLAFVVGFTSCKGEKDKDQPTDEQETTTNPETTGNEGNVDRDASVVHFVGAKPGEIHHGSFKLDQANLEMSDGNISGGSFAIDIASMDILDEGIGAEEKAKLIGHLSSPDFFNYPEHPYLTFNITGVEESASEVMAIENEMAAAALADLNGAGTHTVSGSMMVKGEAYDISFPANVSMEDGMISAKGIISVLRKDIGLRFQGDTEPNVDQQIYIGIDLKAKA